MRLNHLCPGCMEEKGRERICPHCGYEERSAPESLLHLPPGTVLQGKYVIGRALGQGGFGITYLAWDKNLKIKLAIKEYLPQQLATRTSGRSDVVVYKSSLYDQFKYGLRKFLEEARTLARFIEHPNVVSVRDYFEANKTAYLVMNYHEGVTLQQYLQARGGKIAFEQALDIFMPVLDALKEVHAAGILHRDISPDNLLVNTRGQVVLIDFGAARQAMGEKSRSLSVIMKAGYSPEEQYRSRGEQGPWTDIYAVAATFYRSITGQNPPESLDRLAEDLLVSPSEMGVKIETGPEQALLKALSIKAEERYRNVEDFQKALIYKEKVETGKEELKAVEPALPDSEKSTGYRTTKKEKKEGTFWGTGKKSIRTAAAVIAAGLLLFGIVSLLSESPEELVSEGSLVDEVEEAGVFVPEETEEKAEALDDEPGSDHELALNDQVEEPDDPDIAEPGPGAEYMIDAEGGTMALSDLEIGSRVVDPSWQWGFRTEQDYTGGGEIKAVIWILVAKNHYEGLDPHVTLLSEELIGKQAFDNSTDRQGHDGSSHWGDSGTTNAERGLRPWLNSTGIHAGGGFYEAFSDHFKAAVLTTGVPNKEFEDGNDYITEDRVFIPSITELGDDVHLMTHRIGSVFPYFEEADHQNRIACLGGSASWYWTRSPAMYVSIHSYYRGSILRYVTRKGGFSNINAHLNYLAVRPVLNLDSELMVSEITD